MVTCFSTVESNILDFFGSDGFDAAGLDGLLRCCTAERAAEGRDLSAYNTMQNARDVRALMQTLGYGAYNIYGFSYCAKRALEVMHSAPDGVRSEVIDSAFPPKAPPIPPCRRGHSQGADAGELVKLPADGLTADQAVIARLLLEAALAERRDEGTRAVALAGLSDSRARSARDATSLAERRDRR